MYENEGRPWGLSYKVAAVTCVCALAAGVLNAVTLESFDRPGSASEVGVGGWLFTMLPFVAFAAITWLLKRHMASVIVAMLGLAAASSLTMLFFSGALKEWSGLSFVVVLLPLQLALGTVTLVVGGIVWALADRRRSRKAPR